MDVKNWHYSTMAVNACKALNGNQFSAEFFSDRGEAIQHIMSLIDPNDSVGTGGSMTLTELGIHEMLIQRGNKLLDHSTAETINESMAICRQQLTADVFMSSANATVGVVA